MRGSVLLFLVIALDNIESGFCSLAPLGSQAGLIELHTSLFSLRRFEAQLCKSSPNCFGSKCLILN